MRKSSPLQATFERICQSAAKELSRLMDTRNMYVALYDQETDTIEFPFWSGSYGLISASETVLEHRFAPRRFGERRGLTDWVIENKKPLLIERDFEKELVTIRWLESASSALANVPERS